MPWTYRLIIGIIFVDLTAHCHTHTYHTHVLDEKYEVQRKFVKGPKLSGENT